MDKSPKLACDAMCGGLARWLRLLGVNATYEAHIEDGVLVRHALAEGRIVVSSDHKLFERRVFVTGELRGLMIPVGLKLIEQVIYTWNTLGLQIGFPRCTRCNGELEPVSREEVADVVPARSLIWAKEFHRCKACGQVFWEGTHWRRINQVQERLRDQASDDHSIGEQ